jgi:hypothetical protein
MGLFGGDGGGGGKEFDSQEYRDKYDKLSAQYQQLYNERWPILKEYEKNSKEQLHALISKSAPQAAQLYANANKLMGAADKNLQSALGYDTQGRRTQERGKAMADVGVAADASRKSALDRLESYGIDPSQTRSASLDAGLQLETALNKVKAAQDAEIGVEERGREYVDRALGVSAGALGTATGASATGTGMLQGNVQATNQTSQLYADIFGSPMDNLGAQTAINTLKMQAKQAEQASKVEGESALGQLGSLAGMAAGGVAGYYASGGNPMGAVMGAQAGQQLTSGGGGGGGGGATWNF